MRGNYSKSSSIKGFEKLEDRCLYAGVTILTHGFLLDNQPPAWINSMADAIAERKVQDDTHWYEFELEKFYIPPSKPRTPKNEASYLDIAQFRLVITKQNTQFDTTVSYNNNFSDAADPQNFDLKNSLNAEAIIALDWSTLATAEQSTVNIAKAAANYILKDTPLNNQLLSLPIHLIGHSRGASLMAALAEKLGEKGLFVDQLTLLDPIPVSGDWGFLDSQLTLPENVVFADNYYRKWEFLSRNVLGAHQINLKNVVDKGGYGSSPAQQHSNTHLWYQGTISHTFPFSDGEIKNFNPDKFNWYTEYPKYPDAKNGYIHAVNSLEKNILPKDGLAESILGLAGTAQRKKITNQRKQFDNIMFTEAASPQYKQSQKIPLQILYTDDNNDATVSIGFDADANPFNGVETINDVTQYVRAQSQSATLFLDRADLRGAHYVYAKIKNGQRTRYAYLKPFDFLSADEPFQYDLTPHIVSVSNSSSKPEEILVKYMITNVESVPTDNSAITLGWYLSSNNFITNTDTLLATQTIDYIPHATSMTLEKMIVLPLPCDALWQTNKSYELGLIIDPANFLTDNEENNAINIPLKVNLSPYCPKKAALMLSHNEDILATAAYPITLALHTQPNSDVKVTFVSETNAEINVSPETIIFSPNNWNVNQAISFSNNKIKESNKNYLVNLFTTSDDISYNNLQDILELTVFDKGTGNLHNPFMQYDVNDDDTVSSQDVLIIFNALNNNAFPSQSPPYLDVSDDGHITPLDALQVINYINNQEAEAENIQSQFFQPLQNSFNPPTVDLIFQNDFFLDSFFQKKEKKLKHRRQ